MGDEGFQEIIFRQRELHFLPTDQHQSLRHINNEGPTMTIDPVPDGNRAACLSATRTRANNSSTPKGVQT